ncbi:hypothetical protein ABIB62_003000 [Mucilaginibacter sp. UYP25]
MTKVGLNYNNDGQVQEAEVFPVPSNKGAFFNF